MTEWECTWIDDSDPFLWQTVAEQWTRMNGRQRSWDIILEIIQMGYATHVDYAGAVDVYVHHMEPTFIDTNKAFHLFPAPSPSVA